MDIHETGSHYWLTFEGNVLKNSKIPPGVTLQHKI